MSSTLKLRVLNTCAYFEPLIGYLCGGAFVVQIDYIWPNPYESIGVVAFGLTGGVLKVPSIAGGV